MIDDRCPSKLPKLGYLAWRADTERRMERGEDQRLCAACERWRWAHEQKACPQWKHDPDLEQRIRAFMESEDER